MRHSLFRLLLPPLALAGALGCGDPSPAPPPDGGADPATSSATPEVAPSATPAPQVEARAVDPETTRDALPQPGAILYLLADTSLAGAQQRLSTGQAVVLLAAEGETHARVRLHPDGPEGRVLGRLLTAARIELDLDQDGQTEVVLGGFDEQGRVRLRVQGADGSVSDWLPPWLEQPQADDTLRLRRIEGAAAEGEEPLWSLLVAELRGGRRAVLASYQRDEEGRWGLVQVAEDLIPAEADAFARLDAGRYGFVREGGLWLAPPSGGWRRLPCDDWPCFERRPRYAADQAALPDIDGALLEAVAAELPLTGRSPVLTTDDAGLAQLAQRAVRVLDDRNTAPQGLPDAWFQQVWACMPELSPMLAYPGYAAGRCTGGEALAYLLHRVQRHPAHLWNLYRRFEAQIPSWLPPDIWQRQGLGRTSRRLLATRAALAALPEVEEKLDAAYQNAVEVQRRLATGDSAIYEPQRWENDYSDLARQLPGAPGDTWEVSFWARREAEGNAEAVARILQGLEASYASALRAARHQSDCRDCLRLITVADESDSIDTPAEVTTDGDTPLRFVPGPLLEASDATGARLAEGTRLWTARPAAGPPTRWQRYLGQPGASEEDPIELRALPGHRVGPAPEEPPAGFTFGQPMNEGLRIAGLPPAVGAEHQPGQRRRPEPRLAFVGPVPAPGELPPVAWESDLIGPIHQSEEGGLLIETPDLGWLRYRPVGLEFRSDAFNWRGSELTPPMHYRPERPGCADTPLHGARPTDAVTLGELTRIGAHPHADAQLYLLLRDRAPFWRSVRGDRPVNGFASTFPVVFARDRSGRLTPLYREDLRPSDCPPEAAIPDTVTD